MKMTRKEYDKAYYQNNKDKQKTYYEKNKTEILAKQKADFNNKEVITSHRLNGNAHIYFRAAICEGLNVSKNSLYKSLKNIDNKGVIETKDGKKYILKLTEIK